MGDNFHHLPAYPGQAKETALLYPDPTFPSHTQQPLCGSLANIEPGVYCDKSLRSNSGERSANPRVPIPRSTYPTHDSPKSRVSRACENCRRQKAKCSGGHPACQRCQNADIGCSYSVRKKDRMLRKITSLTTQVQKYEELLRDLYPQLDSSSAHRIDQAMIGGKLAPESFASPMRGTKSSIASAHAEEDFNRDEISQAIGSVGRHSEVAWLYLLKRDIDRNYTFVDDNSDQPSISSVHYFQDIVQIAIPSDVNTLAQPPQPIADQLIEAYFRIVHPEFPIVGMETFLGQYRSLSLNANLRPGKRWMAVLNLVFAISARYSHLLQSQSPEENTNHPTYFARAWRLSLAENMFLDHPTLQQVQVEGLAALYLLSIGQVNRSWRAIGIAIRSGVAMGLNLRIEGDRVAPLSKEVRYRVWWALLSLDTVLSAVTGRPPSTSEVFCTTPFPLPYPEEDFWEERVARLINDPFARITLFKYLLSKTPTAPITPEPGGAPPEPNHPAIIGARNITEQFPRETDQPTPNASLCFFYMVDLTFLLRRVIETLYAPGAMSRSWQDIELAALAFNNEADNWLTHLPPEFHFGELEVSQAFIRQRASLAFQFYTTKLLISQPCLHRLAYQLPAAASSTTCNIMATMCVQAACQMLDMLPGEGDPDWLYKEFPWWCVLHYVMQSITILLVELFKRAQHESTEIGDLTEKVQNAIRWLRMMSVKDPCSQEVWIVCVNILSQFGSKFSLNIDNEILVTKSLFSPKLGCPEASTRGQSQVDGRNS